MSDVALTIIIVVAIIMSAPVWIPLLYLAGLAMIGFVAAIAGFVLLGIVRLAIAVEDFFTRKS